jgi:pimeloyl-ACP methyl ester carboxylesterase
MRSFHWFWLAVFLVCACLAGVSIAPRSASAEETPAAEAKPAAGAKAKADIAGTWQGTLDVAAARLRLVVEFKEQEGGGYSGMMDSPDQGAFGLKIDEVTLEGNKVKFTMKTIGGSFAGELSDDRKEIQGKWTQGGQALDLVLKPGEKVAPAKRPQEPKPPYPYAEEEVMYENKAAGIKIMGTLTLPKEGGPFPAVLLITGSGAQNRNEELLGHKPFLVWADYLTRRGMAVLRVDDRGVGGTGGKPGESTIEDHAGDALAGVAFLRSRPDIDATKIGLIGHSEGGVVAPAAAVRSDDVAFIVLLAGTGVTGEEILYSQGALIGRAMGMPPEQIVQTQTAQRLLFSGLKLTANVESLLKTLAPILEEAQKEIPEEQRLALERVGEGQIQMMPTPWFRHFLTYDPAPVLEKVRCPVLAICGEKDLQVDPKLNLPKMEAALKAGGNKDFTVQELPGLNHLFQKCETGSPAEYSQIEETINPVALEIVGKWLTNKTATP